MISRRTAAGLTASAALLIGLAVHEGYRDTAYTPLPGDKPTIGFGDTHGVKPGDKTDPVRALIKLGGHVNAIERELHACVRDVPLTQGEWDALVDLAYRVGSPKVCGSTLVSIYHTQPVNYAAACEQYKSWTYFKKKDCRNPINKCKGVVDRAEFEYALCTGSAK